MEPMADKAPSLLITVWKNKPEKSQPVAMSACVMNTLEMSMTKVSGPNVAIASSISTCKDFEEVVDMISK